MSSTSTINNILATYEIAGYKKDDIIAGVKSIDNWFTNNTGKKWSDLTTEVTSVVKGPRANLLRYDQKFIDICQSIAYTPKTQYHFYN